MQHRHKRPSALFSKVSVPSTGRSGLQLTFETIEVENLFEFQYPLRVEVGCNLRARSLHRSGKRFQYPLRVEVGCNSMETASRSAMARSFSTLYGSKWVATYFFQARLHACFMFQYPLRVEVGCNADQWVCSCEGYSVSVPSTGRSGLQHNEEIELQ